MTHQTTDSTYLVFGASGGIGSAVARRLHASGVNVALASRSSSRLDNLARETDSPVWEIEASDVGRFDTVTSEVADQFGRLDGVVNCLGSVLLKSAHLTSDQEWDAVITANLTSAFAVLRAAAKAMRKTGGSIVLMSSAAARIGLANHEAIAAAKAGVVGLTLSAAATYAAKGIRVNCVAPGLVKTPLTRKIWDNATSATASRAMHALGRLGEPDDVASIIVWLLDPSNSWVTGQTIGVDGGLGSVRSRG
jgi:NAD(P)-dependent dehydrogenase (short-subunit alcohol dehydrogenase family)